MKKKVISGMFNVIMWNTNSRLSSQLNVILHDRENLSAKEKKRHLDEYVLRSVLINMSGSQAATKNICLTVASC